MRTFSQMCMGIVLSVFRQNDRVIPDVSLPEKHYIQISAGIFCKRACSADLLAEVLKTIFSEGTALSGRPADSSNALHPVAATFRADMDVCIPYVF